MHISRENIDELNAIITLKITEEDYSQNVDTVLKDYRRKARIDGFRPGMAPPGLIRKLYFKPVLVEEVNKLVGEKLMDYIRDENIRILGEPLPNVEKNPEFDFDKDKDFEFSFDIGLYPEISISVTENDKIPYYKIKLKDEVIDETIKDVAYRYGEMTKMDEISGTEAVKGNVYQSDEEGQPGENGISIDDVTLSLEYTKEKNIIELFTGKKVSDRVTFILKEAFNDEDALRRFLRIDKDDEADLEGYFTMEITEINRFSEHVVNQELYDKVYGEGQIKSDEEFRNKIREEIEAGYERESEYRFTIDARDYYLENANLVLPVEFLKRWLVETQENINKEELDKDFSEYENDFKWQIIKDHFIKDNEIKVSEQEMLEFAMNTTKNQFYGYGMHNIPEEYIEKYAREQLAKPETSKKLVEQRLSEKVFRFIRETVKIKEKEITIDEFKKLYEE